MGRHPITQRRRRRHILSEALESRLLLAVTINAIDTDTSTADSNPSTAIDIGGIAFFTATGNVTEPGTSIGKVLWRSDGTAAGTWQVKDFLPGSDSETFSGWFNYNGVALFQLSYTGGPGRELYRSDGTEAGTYLVKDIRPGAGDSSIASMTLVNGLVYFTAEDGTHGTDLWRTDGTQAGTQMVTDILPNHGSGIVAMPVSLNGQTYFAANKYNGSTFESRPIYVTDGTDAGTAVVATITPGAGTLTGTVGVQTGTPLVAFGNALYFHGSDGTAAGKGLYRWDGVSATATLVKTFASIGDIRAIGGRLYVLANDAAAGTGTELFVSDGTPAGTTLLKDIKPGTGSGLNSFAPVTLGGNVFFLANSAIEDAQLWRTDGTPDGTVLVTPGHSALTQLTATDTALFWVGGQATNQEVLTSNGTVGNITFLDVEPGSVSSNPTYLKSLGSVVVFQATTSVGGTEVWRSDGTTAGTFMARDIYPGSRSGWVPSTTGASVPSPSVVGNKLYFRADDYDHGAEMWVTDGTVVGTTLVKDVNAAPGVDLVSAPRQLGDKRVIAARTKATGMELYLTDGVNTTLLKDIVPGSAESRPFLQVVHNGVLYFIANTPANGREVWRTDGTAGGTFMLKDIYAGATSSDPNYFIAAGPYVYFRASNNATNQEVWRTDGSQTGTIQLGEINPSTTTGASAADLTAVGNKLIFSAVASSAQGRELFVSDGTVGTTGLLKELNTAPNTGGDPKNFTMMNGVLYFSAYGNAGWELWGTNGSPTYTLPVADIAAGVYSSSPGDLAVAGNRLFFTAVDNTATPAHGRELWVTDGFADTHLVKDITPGSGSSNISQISGLPNGKAVFLIGKDLWVSDGTDSGTVMLQTMPDIVQSTYPYRFFVGGNLAYFRVRNNPGGSPTTYDIWRTDGTAAGTFKLDVAGVTDSIEMSAWDYIGGRTYMLVISSAYGREVMWTDGTVAGSTILDLNPGYQAPGNVTRWPSFTEIDGSIWFIGNNGQTGAALFRISDFAETAGTTLKIKASAAGGSITVTPSGGDALVKRNGDALLVPPASFDAIEIAGSAGNDAVTLGVPLPIAYAAGGGTDSLTFSNAGGGPFTLGADLGAGGQVVDVTVNAGASLVFGQSQHLRTLSLSNGSAALTPGGGKVLAVNTLAGSGTWSLDLADNDLIARSNTWIGVESAVRLGANGGDWQGIGIRTSQPAALDGLTTLGVARAADVLDFASPTATALFSGETVTGSAILVKYTYAGDANLDGIISGDDYAAIDLNIAMPGASGYFNGDFNYDGIISGDDYAAIDLNIVAQGPAL